MENTMNDNYDSDYQNYHDKNRSNVFEDSKLNDGANLLDQDDFDPNDPENFYNNDKNSNPQKSEFTSEAELSNQPKDDEDLEDVEDFDDIELDAEREDFMEVENEDDFLKKDDFDENDLDENDLDEDDLDEDDLDEDDLDEDDDYNPNETKNGGNLNNYSSN